MLAKHCNDVESGNETCSDSKFYLTTRPQPSHRVTLENLNFLSGKEGDYKNCVKNVQQSRMRKVK